MDTNKSIKCTIGWHHWDVATEDRIVVRTCHDCGRRRYHGSAGPDRGGQDGAFMAGGWGFGGGGFGGFDGGGCGGDGGGGC